MCFLQGSGNDEISTPFSNALCPSPEANTNDGGGVSIGVIIIRRSWELLLLGFPEEPATPAQEDVSAKASADLKFADGAMHLLADMGKESFQLK